MAKTKEVIEQPKPEMKRRKATLDDLKPSFLLVDVIDIDDDGEPITLEFKLKTLSYFAYNSLGIQVPDPSPDTVGVDKNGRPIYDTTSWKYRVGLNESNNQRMLLRLAAALVEPKIPGDDPQSKSQWIQENMPPGIVNQLSMLMAVAANKGEARIANRADNFQ